MPGLDPYDPFRSWLQTAPGMSHDEERKAVEAMLTRDALTEQFLHGQTDLETLWDCIAEQGEDPFEWTDQTISQMERIIDGGMVFTSNENGLFLPQQY